MTIVNFSQGAEANRGGQQLEQALEREFRSLGVEVFDYTVKGENGDMFNERFLLRNVPYTSIYGCECRTEFVYRDFRLEDIRIECKWQQSSGSVDEKFPYFLENALHAYPEKHVWFVVEGGGAKRAAVNWFETNAAAVAAKTIRVMNWPETRKRIRALFA